MFRLQNDIASCLGWTHINPVHSNILTRNDTLTHSATFTKIVWNFRVTLFTKTCWKRSRNRVVPDINHPIHWNLLIRFLYLSIDKHNDTRLQTQLNKQSSDYVRKLTKLHSYSEQSRFLIIIVVFTIFKFMTKSNWQRENHRENKSDNYDIEGNNSHI
jgi:hypothetical protein